MAVGFEVIDFDFVESINAWEWGVPVPYLVLFDGDDSGDGGMLSAVVCLYLQDYNEVSKELRGRCTEGD